MDKIKNSFMIIGIVLTIGLLVGGGFFIAKHIFQKDNTRPASEKNHDIVLTTNDITKQLKSISQLMTYEYSYMGTATVEDSVEVGNWDVPFTTHKINFTYAGTIKVGYELNDLIVDVDNENKLISIKLGAQIIDNNLPEESVQSTEQNNIFNQIRSDELTNRLVEIKQQEQETAFEDGIGDAAEDHAKQIIKDALVDFEGYTVEFVGDK